MLRDAHQAVQEAAERAAGRESERAEGAKEVMRRAFEKIRTLQGDLGRAKAESAELSQAVARAQGLLEASEQEVEELKKR